MEEIAEVYARSLFEVAQENDKLDEIHEELGEFADALSESREPRGSPATPQMAHRRSYKPPAPLTPPTRLKPLQNEIRLPRNPRPR